VGIRRHRLADAHRDANEQALLRVFEKLGGHWWEGGPLDGWALQRGVFVPVEIKLPEREGTAREFTPLQKRFMSWCVLHSAPHHIWRDDKDVLHTLGARVGA
jgi:hypothetical protein